MTEHQDFNSSGVPPERDIDQEIRINELQHRIEEAGGVLGPAAEGCPPDVYEAFLNNIMMYEDAPETTHFEQLQRDGVVLPPPEEITEEELPRYLEAFIQALARRRVYLSSTDHLSDRELYTVLWSDLTREGTPDFPPEMGINCHLDILGGCSEEDIRLQLMYYADDRAREEWVREFPDYVLPDRVKPPYDRDRFLPQVTYGQPQMEGTSGAEESTNGGWDHPSG